MDDMKTLGRRLKELRESLGLSQNEFARRLGFTRGVVTNSERGIVEIRPLYIEQVCRTYNVRKEWLETGEGEMLTRLPEDEQIAEAVTRILYKEPESFRARLISVLTKLSDDDLDVLIRLTKQLAGTDEE